MVHKHSSWQYLCIILIQEVYNSNVIFERDNVRFGENFGRGEIGRRGFDGTEQVFGKADGVDLRKRD